MCYRRTLRIPGDKFLHVNGSPSKDAFPRNQFRYAAIWRDRLEPLNPVYGIAVIRPSDRQTRIPKRWATTQD
jgi:hypothetical protein